MSNNKALIWAELTSKEIENAIELGCVNAFLPFGSTEQHGPHLISGYDTYFAKRLSFDLADFFRGFVMPSIPYGMAEHHLGFVGTIHVKVDTLISLLSDIATSLEKNGIENLVIVNGHGGNYSLIEQFSRKWNGRLKIIHDANKKILFSKLNHWGEKVTAADCGIHGGFFETSIAMHTHPNLSVRENEFAKGAMPKGDTWTNDEINNLLKNGLKSSTENGVVGDPTGSNPVFGEMFYQSIFIEYVDTYRNQI